MQAHAQVRKGLRDLLGMVDDAMPPVSPLQLANEPGRAPSEGADDPLRRWASTADMEWDESVRVCAYVHARTHARTHAFAVDRRSATVGLAERVPSRRCAIDCACVCACVRACVRACVYKQAAQCPTPPCERLSLTANTDDAGESDEQASTHARTYTRTPCTHALRSSSSSWRRTSLSSRLSSPT